MPTAIAPSPTPGRIYWTAYTDPEGNSEPSDPLRFDMYAQRLGNVLLPGITNRTERLRYLSMVCAGIATTTHTGGRALREQRRAFLPFERGWALAMTVSVDGALKSSPEGQGPQRSLKPEFRGLRGANRVLAHYRTLRSGGTITPTGYILLKSQDAQGGLGAYLVTLRQFGFVQAESLALTATGRALAGAFDPRLRAAPLSTLADHRGVPRRALERLGAALVLGVPTPDERQIVLRTIFEDPHGRTADCVRRMRAGRPDTSDPRSLLQGIARRDGDLLERAAQYAIGFDPLRIALLQLFARLGKQLSGRPGSTPLNTILLPDIEQAANDARTAATRLSASELMVPGLEPVSELARDLAFSSSIEDAVRATIAFHRREGRSWITSDRPNRYAVGRHGSFDEPADAFNGYTVGRAMQLLADAEAAP
jgi:hypothetical protein